jgi:hypothetical protein
MVTQSSIKAKIMGLTLVSIILLTFQLHELLVELHLLKGIISIKSTISYQLKLFGQPVI